jgi:hypothetical protein
MGSKASFQNPDRNALGHCEWLFHLSGRGSDSAFRQLPAVTQPGQAWSPPTTPAAFGRNQKQPDDKDKQDLPDGFGCWPYGIR